MALKTWWGLFEYLVMPFGLTNSTAQFRNMMNDLLGDYFGSFVVIFPDNIFLHFANVQEYAEHLEEVLQVPQEHCLYTTASKCEIFKQSVEFLGQQLCGGGMRLIGAKLMAIRD